MRLMPPAPVRHITFGYGELRERYQRWHYLLAIPMIILVLGLVQLQIWLLPWTRHSVISMWGLFAEKVGFIWAWLLLIMVMIVVNMRRKDHSESRSMSPNTYGFFNKAAVYEEQAFREGAENWTLAQRTTSCLLFGAIHMVNLIYPIAAILPLALGGAIFMHYYLKAYDRTKFRRTAVLESSVVHRVYNRIALFVVLLVVGSLVGSVLVTSLTFFATVVLMRVAMVVLMKRPQLTSRSLQAALKA